jgi:hypothetical protein
MATDTTSSSSGDGAGWDLLWDPLAWTRLTKGVATDVQGAASSWLSGLGGDISSGIEGGFIAVLKDIWVVVGPFVEILAGALLAIFVLMVYFKNDTQQLAGAAVMAAA